MTSPLRPDEPGLLVSPTTVLMAFRYGVGRHTWSQLDALALLREHWPHLARWEDSIRADLETTIRLHADQPGVRDTADRAREALAWIDARKEQP